MLQLDNNRSMALAVANNRTFMRSLLVLVVAGLLGPANAQRIADGDHLMSRSFRRNAQLRWFIAMLLSRRPDRRNRFKSRQEKFCQASRFRLVVPQ
jgi:hypothetical protein